MTKIVGFVFCGIFVTLGASDLMFETKSFRTREGNSGNSLNIILNLLLLAKASSSFNNEIKAVAHDISGSFCKRPKRELRLNSLSL